MIIKLYSWFYSGNIGDIMISRCVSELFTEKHECIFYDITSGNRVNETKLVVYNQVKKTWKTYLLNNSIFRSIIEFIDSFKYKQIMYFENDKNTKDVLTVFAGGNSLMDLGKVLPGNAIVMLRRLKILKKQGAKIAFVFCGVGPYKNVLARMIAKKTLGFIDFLSVRDETSYDYCKKLGYDKQIEIWRDPVLFHHPNIENKEKKKIAVNVFFGADKARYKKMLRSYEAVIKYLREKYADYEICLFASETQDRGEATQLKELFLQDGMVQEVIIANEKNLFELYSNSKITIGCRMHSLIMSVICDVPIVAIAWQPKVFALMSYLKRGNAVVSQMDFCNSKRIFDVIDDVIINGNNSLAGIKEIINDSKIEFNDNLISFWERWNTDGL